jgi:hypothetical protein
VSTSPGPPGLEFLSAPFRRQLQCLDWHTRRSSSISSQFILDRRAPADPTDGEAIPRMKDGTLCVSTAWQLIRGIASPSVGLIPFSDRQAKKSGAEK